MLTTIEVRTPQTYVPQLILPVVDVSPDAPFHVRNVTGLEPVAAAVNSRGYGSLDGEFYVGSHVGKRNIVLTLGLNTRRGFESVSEARNLLYSYLMPKMNVTLRFLNDDQVPVEIAGYVESLTPNRFAQDPEMQVSILCPKPYFVGLQKKTITGMSGSSPVDTVFINQGNVINGVTFSMPIGGVPLIGRVSLEARADGVTYRKFDLTGVFIGAGTTLGIVSTQGNKRVENQKAGRTPYAISLLGKLTAESLWTYLVPGTNRVRVVTSDSLNERQWTLSYYEQFGGI